MPPVLVVPGIDTINVSNLDLTLLGHGICRGSSGRVQDITVLIRREDQPSGPAIRAAQGTHAAGRDGYGLSDYERLSFTGGWYWGLDDDLLEAMRRLQERDGISFSEQMRRALRPWLESKGVIKKAERKRAGAHKRS